MKKILTFTFLFGALFAGCHKNSTDPGGPSTDVTSYPAGAGSTWTYRHTNRMENFRPSFPGATLVPDSIEATATVTVTRFVRLPSGSGPANDSVLTAEFQKIETVNRPTYYTSVGFQYYSFDSSGMYLRGYRGAGGSMATPKAVPGGQYILLKGMTFRSVQDLSERVQLGVAQLYADSLQLQIPPRKVLQFPLSTGTNWTYIPSNPWRIEKSVVTDTTIAVGSLSYHCFRVQWLYDMNNDGVWDDNILFNDYIGTDGLLRRSITFKDIIVATTQSPDGIGVVDDKEEYNAVTVDPR